MFNDTPVENTNYTQYNITQNETRHIITNTLENEQNFIYYTLNHRLCLGSFSIKVEEKPTFFGDFFAFTNNQDTFIGVKNA